MVDHFAEGYTDQPCQRDYFLRVITQNRPSFNRLSDYFAHISVTRLILYYGSLTPAARGSALITQPSKLARKPLALLIASLLAVPALAAPGDPTVYDTIGQVAQHLAEPPADARPMMRWWWFGPAVEKKQLAHEIAMMKQGGIGGFEIQPVYPMELDDPARGTRNLRYLSKEFLDMLTFANNTGRAAGLRVDLTLGSGWPYGGPHIGITDAIARMRVVPVEVPAGAASYALPSVMNGEKIEATFIGDGTAKAHDATRLQPFAAAAPAQGRAAIAPSSAARVVVHYIASRSGMQVKRPAIGAEGFVLDHMSRRATDNHLTNVGEPLLKAFGKHPPYSIFSDSLEAYGGDWTGNFLDEFAKRRGYDLRPLLPRVYGDKPDPAIRRDWARTMTELVEEHHLKPIAAWARKHGTRFRSQVYGEPPAALSSFRHVDLFDGEGAQFRQFSYTRLATSAAHLYNRPVASSETWTWLHSPAHTASPLDMKAEADRMFVQGINQIVGHGWPYTPPNAPEPGYQLYAAAVFNHHQPWYMVMPEINRYLSRVSYLMRQGAPANQIAVFLPNDDVYAVNKPGKPSLSGHLQDWVKPELIQQIMDAGHNLDYVDADAILSVGIDKFPVLVMPHVQRLAPEVIARLAEYVKKGGQIIAIGSTPSLAPGYKDAERISAQVRQAADALFSTSGTRRLASEADLGPVLRTILPGDLQASSGQASISFYRRKLKDADIYFVANTTNEPVATRLTFRDSRRHATRLDPLTGKLTISEAAPALTLAPYESTVFVLSDAPLKGAAQPIKTGAPAVVADLSTGWKVDFPNLAVNMDQLKSWTDYEATRYYSGTALYTRRVQMDAAQLQGRRVSIDFGSGTPIPTDNTHAYHTGMRAMYEPALRSAAIVTINGKRAGALWTPPFRLDATPYLKPGENVIEVKVANLAVNVLAGRALPDFSLLRLRHGNRFELQDTAKIAPQPAGLLGPVQLIGEPLQ